MIRTRPIFGVVVSGWVCGYSGAALAQDQNEQVDFWTDTGAQNASDDERPVEAQSLRAARTAGESVRIGAGVPIRDVPPTHTVRSGDTLWDITEHYFGSPWHWPRVWSFNPEITNPHWIFPQNIVRLQAASGTQDTAQAASTQPPQASFNVVRTRARTESEMPVLLREEGFIDADALRKAGTIVGSFEEHMMLAEHDRVYVSYTEEPAPLGTNLTIFRPIDSDEREVGEEGKLVRIFGTAQVIRYDEQRRVATCEITEVLDPVERGMLIAPLARRFEIVPPVPNDRDLQTRITAVIEPQRLIGTYQLVFVPVGSEQGVRIGNRFRVEREGDEWRRSLHANERLMGATVDVPREPREYPIEQVGEARVVQVRPNSAALLILNELDPVAVGEKLVMHRGE